jgi:lysozyme family protein
MSFETAIPLILVHEGGLSDHPHDPGGLTKFGISQRAYPDLDIRNISVEQAKAIYKRDYWDRIKGDSLPEGISTLVFDSAVNQGVPRATKMMQRALSVDADGIIGPRTLAAASRANLRDFAVRFGVERAMHYASLPTFSIFGKGWLRRLFDVTTRVIHGTEAE